VKRDCADTHPRTKGPCSPYQGNGVRCYCDKDYCNGEQIDAIASPDSESDSTDSPSGTSDAPDSPDSSDSLKSADPEMIVLLISLIIAYLL